MLDRVSNGEALYKVCQDIGIDPASVRHWAADPRRAWFGAAFREAQKNQGRRWAEEVVTISDESASATAAHEVYSYQLRCNARKWAASKLVPEEFGERPPVVSGGGATVHIYLPGKPEPGDSARVIEGTAQRLEDGSEDAGTE